MDNPYHLIGYMLGATAARLVLHWPIAVAAFLVGARFGRFIWVLVAALCAVGIDLLLKQLGLSLGGAGTLIGSIAEFLAAGLAGTLGLVVHLLWKRSHKATPDPAAFE